MSNSKDTLLKLLRIALGVEPDLSLPENVSWAEVYDLANSQGVSAIVLDGINMSVESQNEGICSSFELPKNESLRYEWLGRTLSVEKRNINQFQVIKRLSDILATKQYPFLLMKGFACSKYYPIPSHRECGDVDIFLGKNYKNSNLLLSNSGIDVDEYYYRHSASHVNGIMIENHRVLCDTRGPKETKEFERQLWNLGEKSLFDSNDSILFGEKIRGLRLPSADFNALFLPWHVSAHFAFEKVTLRHVLDWALFLMNDGNDVDIEMFREAKKKYSFGYRSFADILTAIAIDKIGIPEENFPVEFVKDKNQVDLSLVDKVFDYIFQGGFRHRNENVWRFRINNVISIWNERWKYKIIYNISVFGFLYYKIKGSLRKEGV